MKYYISLLLKFHIKSTSTLLLYQHFLNLSITHDEILKAYQYLSMHLYAYPTHLKLWNILIDYILQYENDDFQHLIHRILLNPMQRYNKYNDENNMKIQYDENTNHSNDINIIHLISLGLSLYPRHIGLLYIQSLIYEQFIINKLNHKHNMSDTTNTTTSTTSSNNINDNYNQISDLYILHYCQYEYLKRAQILSSNTNTDYNLNVKNLFHDNNNFISNKLQDILFKLNNYEQDYNINRLHHRDFKEDNYYCEPLHTVYNSHRNRTFINNSNEYLEYYPRVLEYNNHSPEEESQTSTTPLLLQLGCSDPYKCAKVGWRTADVIDTISTHYHMNASDLWQLGNSSVDELYTSHMLEHLEYSERGGCQVSKALKEWRRVLKLGGVSIISIISSLRVTSLSSLHIHILLLILYSFFVLFYYF